MSLSKTRNLTKLSRLVTNQRRHSASLTRRLRLNTSRKYHRTLLSKSRAHTNKRSRFTSHNLLALQAGILTKKRNLNRTRTLVYRGLNIFLRLSTINTDERKDTNRSSNANTKLRKLQHLANRGPLTSRRQFTTPIDHTRNVPIRNTIKP